MTKGPPDLAKFREGYSALSEYLVELYRGIDGFMGQFQQFHGKISEDDLASITKRHEDYKSALKSLDKKLKGSVDVIDGLLRKAQDVKTPKDDEAINGQINAAYKPTFEASVDLYRLLDPGVDAFQAVNHFYTADLKDQSGKVAIKGLDRSLFARGSGFIEKYFLEDGAIAEIKKNAQAAKHQQEANAQ